MNIIKNQAHMLQSFCFEPLDCPGRDGINLRVGKFWFSNTQLLRPGTHFFGNSLVILLCIYISCPMHKKCQKFSDNLKPYILISDLMLNFSVNCCSTFDLSQVVLRLFYFSPIFRPLAIYYVLWITLTYVHDLI